MVWPPGLNRASASDLALRNQFLNDNWDTIDNSFSSLYVPAGVTPAVASPVAGLEWLNNAGKLMSYDGSTWKEPETTETWGAWQNLNLQSPFVGRGTSPRIRVSNYKNVEVEGGLSYNNVDWPVGTDYFLIHGGQFQNTYLPEVTSVFSAGTSLPGATGFNASQVYITVGGSPLTLQIYVCFLGTRISSNSVQFSNNIRYKAA